MRAAYQIALGAEFIDPIDAQKLDTIRKDQKDIPIPRGWIRVGRRRDVPHGTCIVSHCGKTYAWVVPGRSKDFADFTLLMLNIATWIPPAAKGQAAATVHPRVEPLPRSEEAEAESPGIQMRLYEDSQSINRGLSSCRGSGPRLRGSMTPGYTAGRISDDSTGPIMTLRTGLVVLSLLLSVLIGATIAGRGRMPGRAHGPANRR